MSNDKNTVNNSLNNVEFEIKFINTDFKNTLKTGVDLNTYFTPDLINKIKENEVENLIERLVTENSNGRPNPNTWTKSTFMELDVRKIVLTHIKDTVRKRMNELPKKVESLLKNNMTNVSVSDRTKEDDIFWV